MVKNIGAAGFNVGSNKVGTAVKKIPFNKVLQAGKDAKLKLSTIKVKERISLKKK